MSNLRSPHRFALVVAAVFALAVFFVACGGDGGGDDDGNGNVTGNGNGEVAMAFDACQKSDEKQFPNGPETIIDTDRTYIATITTDNGQIVVELFSDTPITTNNFVFLACKGYYDGVTFHRVIPDFVAQGGDPTGSGSGGPGYSIPDEDDGDHTMEAGVISMAKAGPNTTGSQFFITYTPQPGLDADFTVFGRVTEGMDVVGQITPRDPAQDPNAPPGDIIESITIQER